MSSGSDKSADAFRTISEVANELGLATHVLRFWESKFPQIKPLKRAGGRRYYRPDDVALLRKLQVLLHDEGYTIKGVQKLLREEGVRTLINDGADAEEPTLQQQPVETPVAATPQASLFDEPAPTPLFAHQATPVSPVLAPEQATQDHTPAEPLEPEDITVTYRPDLLPEAPEPEPVLSPWEKEEKAETVIIKQGLSEQQRALLLDVLGELKSLKEKIDTAA
ncbi:MerR family transcriptional regulator [Terasakiella pusilla]|uniref:MerR family transcriptional regulator n=1 Tax=Terasakiella pusilla TaxID=64973 RepID=UPI003AA91B34